MQPLLQNIRQELQQNIDLRYQKGIHRAFKENEEIKVYGVRLPVVRRIARKYFEQVKALPKQKIFALCEDLLKSDWQEETAIAIQWAWNIKKQYQKEDFAVLEGWLKKYISNWAQCDDLCCHAFGYFILEFPEFVPKVKQWTRSRNRWLRRAAAVIFIYPLKKGRYNDEVFEVVDMLLLDKDELVQKGYGWLLKEVSKPYPQRVFEYVLKHKNYMPRVALRYAIEKLPKEMKQKAMEK